MSAERERNPKAKGLSAQAAGIAAKVAEADAYMRADRGREQWLFECHPELSFYALAGSVPKAGKHSAARGDQEELGNGERDSEGLLMRMVL